MRFEYAVFWSSFVVVGLAPWIYIATLLHGAPADIPLGANAAQLASAAPSNFSAVDRDSDCIERCALQGNGSEVEVQDCRDMCHASLQSGLQVVNSEEAMRATCNEHCHSICMPQCPPAFDSSNCKRQCGRQCGQKCRKVKKDEWKKWKRTSLPGSTTSGMHIDDLDGLPDSKDNKHLNAIGAGGAIVPLFI